MQDVSRETVMCTDLNDFLKYLCEEDNVTIDNENCQVRQTALQFYEGLSSIP